MTFTPITPEVVAAINRMPNGRIQELFTYAQAGEQPGELTDDERLLHDAMVADVLANPCVVWVQQRPRRCYALAEGVAQVTPGSYAVETKR